MTNTCVPVTSRVNNNSNFNYFTNIWNNKSFILKYFIIINIYFLKTKQNIQDSNKIALYNINKVTSQFIYALLLFLGCFQLIILSIKVAIRMSLLLRPFTSWEDNVT